MLNAQFMGWCKVIVERLKSGSEVLARHIVRTLLPPQCLSCSEELETEGFCGKCWGETQFITGAKCDACGVMLAGEEEDGLFCDTCLKEPPKWQRGRAAALYHGGAAKSVMALKYADRWDLARPLAKYMLNAGEPVLQADIVAPVPLHWTRLLRRKFNQAALLSKEIAMATGQEHLPDLLFRNRITAIQKSMDRVERQRNLKDAFSVNSKFKKYLKGKRILLIDDVMTSGATLSECADSCKRVGSNDVNVLVFARVAHSEIIP